MTKTSDKTPKPPRREGPPPPEGPHAKPHLIDHRKTPGSGMFPEPGVKETEPPAG